MAPRRWIDDVLQDVRYGVRSLVANPTFTLIALVTLTVGIGANGLIFSVVSGVLFRPLPYAAPDRLVQVYGTQPTFGSRGAVPSLAEYRAANTLVESMAGYVPSSRIINDPTGSDRVGLVRGERSLFRVLGVEPIAGRTFRDDDPTGTLVVAGTLARRRFGTEVAAIGKTMMIEGETHQIVGVMPDAFRFPYSTPRMSSTLPSLPYELWAVLELPSNIPRIRMDQVVGRLKEGATRTAAQEEMNVTARRLGRENPDVSGGLGIELVPLDEAVVGPVRRQLFILLAAVGLVLLAACANVANLLLVRGSARAREFAVRTAIGAGRGRLVRQLLTESTVLSCAGGALALLSCRVRPSRLLAMPGLAVPRSVEIAVDWRVMGFLLMASVATGLVFGLLPALVASWTNVQEALKSGHVLGRSGVLGRFRDGLAVSEVALAFVLVIGASLLVREFDRLRHTDTGMQTSNVLTMHLAPSLKADDYYAIAGQVEALPGVRRRGVRADAAAPDVGLDRIVLD